ncbi:MAG TPA: PepSY domain-containing protein [Prolixibacteraceae bacterium]|nr:PepSY domain-containing protein [Prolixibacteraceae bacterium]
MASISGLSGSLYVWQPELLQMLNPKILSVSGADTLREETIHKTASELYNRFGENLAALNLPYREQESVQLVLKSGESLYFHPVTGKHLGEKTKSIRFFENLLNFHRTLLIPNYGKYLVGGSTILFFSLLLTSGFYLWWKRYKNNPKEGLSFQRNRSKRIFNYDLHKLIGILFLIPMLIVSFSGTFFTFMPTYKSALQILDSPLQVTGKNTEVAVQYLQPENVLHHTPEDGYKLRAMYFPTKNSGEYRFRYVEKRFISAGLRKTKEIRVNQNHQVTMSTEYQQSSRSEKIVAQAYPIHIGETLGIFGRILVFITGIIPSILLITGYRFYRFRKSKN